MLLSRLVRGDAEVSQMPSEEEMTEQADLPRQRFHASLTENERGDSMQTPGCKPPPPQGFDGMITACAVRSQCSPKMKACFCVFSRVSSPTLWTWLFSGVGQGLLRRQNTFAKGLEMMLHRKTAPAFQAFVTQCFVGENPDFALCLGVRVSTATAVSGRGLRGGT